jgi:hypothetical protein
MNADILRALTFAAQRVETSYNFLHADVEKMTAFERDSLRPYAREQYAAKLKEIRTLIAQLPDELP